MAYHIQTVTPIGKNLFVKTWKNGLKRYLSRISLMPMTRWGQLCLHVFFGPDDPNDPHHDHPYDFWTLGLLGWYNEEFLCPIDGPPKLVCNIRGGDRCVEYEVGTRSHGRGKRMFVKGTHAHKIVHVGGLFGICVTLMWRTPDYREWYLYHMDGTVELGNDKGRPK